MTRLFVCFSLIFLLFFSCKNEQPQSTSSKSLEVNLRITKDPGKVNPFFAPTSAGRHIYQYIFSPLADYHPETLELYPILINEIPVGYDHTLEDGTQTIAYDVILKDGIKWSDGVALTAEDYAFTYNVIKHPTCKATAWKPYFENLLQVKLDPSNPLKLTVYCNPNYMLSKETALTTFLMPQHKFDNNKYLLSTQDKASATDTLVTRIIEMANNSMNAKTDIVQLGPYKITEEQTNEFLILERKENYWGREEKNNPFLRADPDKLIFKIVEDELSAVTMAKEGKLDFMQFRSSDAFLNLRDDPNFNAEWSFHIPQLMSYLYIALNNQKGHLKDKNVRKAMAHLLDVDDIIQALDGGLGARTIGHFHPTKSYYNDALVPIPFDVEKANNYLEQSGWTQKNDNGIRQKMINGKLENLSLEILITGSELSKNLALTFQEDAKKAGVDIRLMTKTSALMRKENFTNFDYDMAALAAGQDAPPNDPYPHWHSDNAVPGTRNITGYSNPQSDVLIEKIRTTRDADLRKEHYLKLQEVMYEDQPMIFLYSPLLKFISHKNLKVKTTSKRPGYLANTFSSAE